MPDPNDLFSKIDMIKLTRVFLDSRLLQSEILVEEFLKNYNGGREEKSSDFKEILPRYIKFLTKVSYGINQNILEFRNDHLELKVNSFWEYAELDSEFQNIIQF